MEKLKFYISDIVSYGYDFLDAKQTYTASEDIDFVLFTGGADVNPKMYGQKQHPLTHTLLTRDIKDSAVFKKYESKKYLKVGICRGAQFLTIKSGGSLIQHVNNHSYTVDEIITDDGVFKISSDHHQMMYPFDIKNYQIIAKSKTPKSTTYENGEGNQVKLPDNIEPEIVYYPNTHSLCIQGHPEWSNGLDKEELQKIRSYVNSLIKYYVTKNK